MLNRTSDNDLKGLFWLASYPKSGNTWFRIFLSNLLSDGSTPVDLNDLGHGQYPNNRHNFDELNGFSSAELSLLEINRLRPAGLSWISEHSDSPLYFKTHAAYAHNANSEPVLGSRNTGVTGALYFVRNPLDVCISYAHHCAVSLDEIIEVMANDALISHANNTHSFIPEALYSWSKHVTSWLDAQEIDVSVIRYEDMKNDTLATFTKACEFLGVGESTQRIQRALDNCRFETLQTLESAVTFAEKPAGADRFFRKGIVGEWQSVLTQSQIDQITDVHGDTMQRLHYLDQNGCTVL